MIWERALSLRHKGKLLFALIAVLMKFFMHLRGFSRVSKRVYTFEQLFLGLPLIKAFLQETRPLQIKQPTLPLGCVHSGFLRYSSRLKLLFKAASHE